MSIGANINKFGRVSLLILSTMCPLSGQAEIWSDTTKITGLYPVWDGYAFTTTYANSAYSTCDNAKRWFISKSNQNYSSMAASLLLAFAADKDIRMVIDEVPPNCQGSVNRFFVYQ